MTVLHGSIHHNESAGYYDPACPNCRVELAWRRERELRQLVGELLAAVKASAPRGYRGLKKRAAAAVLGKDGATR